MKVTFASILFNFKHFWLLGRAYYCEFERKRRIEIFLVMIYGLPLANLIESPKIRFPPYNNLSGPTPIGAWARCFEPFFFVF